jgi:hypothetical protein
MSHLFVYGGDGIILDFKLSIYGATYPGVPHFMYKNYEFDGFYANPKSIMMGYIFIPFYNIIIFYNFKSLCIILFLCI